MKPNQFRIGNFTTRNEILCRVIAIDRCDTLGLTVEVNPENDQPYAQLEPIPLTKEWFLKFGFEKKGRNNFWMFGFLSRMEPYFEFNDNKGYDLFICSEVLVTINYVHQLQNLYFSLEGLELEIIP